MAETTDGRRFDDVDQLVQNYYEGRTLLDPHTHTNVEIKSIDELREDALNKEDREIQASRPKPRSYEDTCIPEIRQKLNQLDKQNREYIESRVQKRHSSKQKKNNSKLIDFVTDSSDSSSDKDDDQS